MCRLCEPFPSLIKQVIRTFLECCRSRRGIYRYSAHRI